MFNEKPFQPKKPGPLQVLTLGRVSTVDQDAEMLCVQAEEVREKIKSGYKGRVNLIELGEQISGEEALRESYVEACELIEGGQIDVVILFDLSKAGRLPRFMHQFVDLCVDCDTRFISVGDNVDTADENWEIAAGAATLIHGTHNRHTRHRIRAKALYLFDNGSMVTKIPYGFRKLSKEEAQSGRFGPKGLRVAKLPEVTPIVRGMKDRVMLGETYEAVARWLNDEGVPTGPYSSKDRWTGKQAINYLRNPLLHGERVFGARQVVRKRTTGQKIRKPGEDPVRKDYPELGHLTSEEHAELIAEMDRRIAAHPRSQRVKAGPKGRARSKTLFPGQLMICGVCGSPFYWRGSIGLQCCSRGDPSQGGCWNHVQVNGDIVRRRVRDFLLAMFDDRPDAKAILIKVALTECERLQGRGNRELDRAKIDIRRLKKEQRNLAAAIRKGGEMNVLVETLQQVEKDLTAAKRALTRLQKQAQDSPVSVGEDTVEAQLPDILDHLFANSYEVSAMMRRIIPKFVVQPLQAIDTGKPVARAYITFRVAALADHKSNGKYVPRPGDFSVALDLFDAPAHIRCLDDAARLHEEHPKWSAEKIAEAIGPDVKRWSVRLALKLHAKMQELSVVEAYVPITDPSQVSRWRMQNGHTPRWNQTT